uniref:Uncharacterized protein n=1 Tax=Anguilla anguilla TaxID=7936 RepID=A0A0E9Q0E0_ANGAN
MLEQFSAIILKNKNRVRNSTNKIQVAIP